MTKAASDNTAVKLTVEPQKAAASAQPAKADAPITAAINPAEQHSMSQASTGAKAPAAGEATASVDSGKDYASPTAAPLPSETTASSIVTPAGAASQSAVSDSEPPKQASADTPDMSPTGSTMRQSPPEPYGAPAPATDENQ